MASNPPTLQDYMNAVNAKLTQVGALAPVRLDPIVEQQVSDLKSDRELREKYALWFVRILVIQLLAMNLIFIANGIGWLKFDEVSLRIFIGGTLTQVFGVVGVITRYLFLRKYPK